MSFESSPSHTHEPVSSTENEALDSYAEANFDPSVDSYVEDNGAQAYSRETTQPANEQSDTYDDIDHQEMPEDVEIRNQLSGSEELKGATSSEKEYRLTALDKLLNKKDRLQRKAMLYDQREKALHWNIARLEGKLATMRPGSHRAKQLENKIKLQRRSLNGIRRNGKDLLNRVANRGSEREKMDLGENAADKLKKRMRKIGEDTKAEKKRRKQIKKEYRSSASETQRENLKVLIKSWEGETIADFYKKKIDEALVMYHKEKISEEVEEQQTT